MVWAETVADMKARPRMAGKARIMATILMKAEAKRQKAERGEEC
jgi:hypothetical protein